MTKRDDEFDRWANALKAASLEAGYPGLAVYRVKPDGYSWTYPIYWWKDISRELQREFQDVFHMACVVCEPLRPSWLTPSPKLEGILNATS